MSHSEKNYGTQSNKQIFQTILTTMRAVLKHQLNKTFKKVDVVNKT